MDSEIVDITEICKTSPWLKVHSSNQQCSILVLDKETATATALFLYRLDGMRHEPGSKIMTENCNMLKHAFQVKKFNGSSSNEGIPCNGL